MLLLAVQAWTLELAELQTPTFEHPRHRRGREGGNTSNSGVSDGGKDS